jgi:hypothetical protein
MMEIIERGAEILTGEVTRIDAAANQDFGKDGGDCQFVGDSLHFSGKVRIIGRDGPVGP